MNTNTTFPRPSSRDEAFSRLDRPHVLMVTNHGLHAFDVTAGLPDTGGQNVFVNQLSSTLVDLGFKVTTANRGGYAHPTTGEARVGTVHRRAGERIIYVPDSNAEFVRKEDMGPFIDELGANLAELIGGSVDLAISHYWDGALVTERALSHIAGAVPHVWFPHSLGHLKRDYLSPEQEEELGIDARIAHERSIVETADFVASTSNAMSRALREGYGCESPLFLPPCVDTRRFSPDAVREDTSAFDLLANALGRTRQDVQRCPIICEVSRSDRTKRKDLLLRAFARIMQSHPDAILALTADRSRAEIYAELESLIAQHGLSHSVALLGSVWEFVPSLYNVSTLYCTPSVMEGFGMSIQEAAACGLPAVASERVPFAVEFLFGDGASDAPSDRSHGVRVGEGVVTVPPDDEEALADAIRLLLTNEELRAQLGRRAHQLTIPRFTWSRATVAFLRSAAIPIPKQTRRDGGTPGE